jgi:8-oxo-dGTP pyrophosphatase MutT (NUDIX family)
MAGAGKTIAVARPAPTVVILRDGRQGLEVFMVVRHQQIDFASGALVFPGGKVDARDEDPAWSDFAPSAADAPDRAVLVAARETFEEAGLVLARRTGEQVTPVRRIGWSRPTGRGSPPGVPPSRHRPR